VRATAQKVKKSGYLCGGASAVLLLKEDVVILVAFKRRVEIHQIDRLIGEISPQDVEVITVVKSIVGHRESFHEVL
jgi:hypothetical protein